MTLWVRPVTMTPMIALRWIAVLCALGGCQASAVEGLQGRWTGRIACAVDVSDITLGLQVLGESITGSALTRAKELNRDWEVSGYQESLDRTTSCRDDSCTTDEDCAGRGGGTCDERGVCVPCTEEERWRRVTLTLKDADVQSPDPVLPLERLGDERLVGTIQGYCRDENLATPSVELNKEK